MVPTSQEDLFAPPKPTGPTSYDLPGGEVLLYESFFSDVESDALFDALKESILWQQDTIKIYGKSHPLPRLTAWYGDPGKSYTYSGIPMRPHPWTGDLLKIKDKIEKTAEVSFSSVLLNFYRTGQDSVSWHRDDEPELGRDPVIGSVSFGATRTFQLRHMTLKNLGKVDIPLTHGSFLLMRGSTQHHWEHQIPKTSRPVKPRINLTFRVIR